MASHLAVAAFVHSATRKLTCPIHVFAPPRQRPHPTHPQKQGLSTPVHVDTDQSKGALANPRDLTHCYSADRRRQHRFPPSLSPHGHAAPRKTAARKPNWPPAPFAIILQPLRRSAIDTQNQPAAQNQSQQARQLAIEIAQLAADTRCTNVVLLDVGAFSPVTDYIILATGTSIRQMRSVADDCAEAAEAHGYKPLSTSGYDSSTWICLDLIDIVVHIFTSEARTFYDLDNLWSDAIPIDIARPNQTKPTLSDEPQEAP